eukprot:Em0002g1630a
MLIGRAQARIGNGVLLNCTTANGRSASLFKQINDGTPAKLPATTLIAQECKDEDTCVFIFALRNLTELDSGNYICSSLSHIYHLNVTDPTAHSSAISNTVAILTTIVMVTVAIAIT